MYEKLKDSRGFTLIELFVVFAILGILAHMALTFTIDLRSRSSDITAVSDGRNLVTVVRNNFVSLDDVDYAKIDGSDIGVETTGGDARPPVFTLSPDVQVKLISGSSGTPDKGFFEVRLYHANGTDVGAGKKEFYYVVDELGEDTLAIF